MVGFCEGGNEPSRSWKPENSLIKCANVNFSSVSLLHDTRVSQMKTLNIFLNIVYCAEVVQSCITFQHNLPHAQCKSSSAYKVHKFL